MRAQALARRIGVSAPTAHGAIRVALADAWRAQGSAADLDQGTDAADPAIMTAMIIDHPETPRHTRLLPPPKRLAPLLRALPAALQQRLLEAAVDRLPWESVPLGLRIALHRGARFARTACAAHHGIA